MPTSRDMAIFVLTTTTQPITLPLAAHARPCCACARGVIKSGNYGKDAGGKWETVLECVHYWKC